MKKSILTLVISCISLFAWSWGATGHRVTGYIADKHLAKKTRLAMQRILGQQSLAMASTWMDDVRSDSLYDMYEDWHWVTIEDNETYDQTKKNPKGDLIYALERIIAELKSKKLSPKEEAERLKMLIHLIGNLNQHFPLMEERYILFRTEEVDLAAEIFGTLRLMPTANGRKHKT